MSDFIRVEVPTRDTSMGGSGRPIVVSAFQIVNHDLTLKRGEGTWQIGLESIPALIAALSATFSMHQAIEPTCHDCKEKGIL